LAADSNTAIMQMTMERRQKTATVIAKTEEALRKAGEQVSWDDVASE